MVQAKGVLALFPGQGSQQVGMGRDFYDGLPMGRELFDAADQRLGFPLSRLCFDGPLESLTATEVVQPAILTVSVICYRAMQTAKPAAVSAAAGHSLGEYSALVAAGALRFEDAVLLVHRRGKYMQEAVARGAGRVVAVLAKEPAEIQAAIDKTDSGVVQVANYNAPGQIVVSGAAGAVAGFLEHLGPAKTVELQVSAPFHCALMEPAARRLASDLDALDIARAAFPVYSNVTGRALTEPEEIREALKRQVCGSVRWVDCMQNAIAETQPAEAIEFGAGSVLSNLLKRIDKEVPRRAVAALKDLGA